MRDVEPHSARVLVLGGTAEARALARNLITRYGAVLDVVTSLAGCTELPAQLPGRVRRGGFGGASGLKDYLEVERFRLVVDATHPFAARISANACAACDAARVPRLVLTRPQWIRQPNDLWHEVADSIEAAQLLPRLGHRVFLTTGARGLAPFAILADTWFLVRLVEEPRDPLPFEYCDMVIGRGPFTIDDELALMRKHGIDVLVSKLSGGTATVAKLDAARALSLPVVMLKRPEMVAGSCVTSVDEAMHWIAAHLLARQD